MPACCVDVEDGGREGECEGMEPLLDKMAASLSASVSVIS